MATFHCNECDRTLKKSNMKRHAHEVHGEGTSTLVYCDMCEYASNRQRDLERHTYRAHHQNKWPTSETSQEKKPTASSQEDPNRKRLIVKLPKPKDLDDASELGPTTATSEDEETRRRALYKIPLIKNRDPHDTMSDFSREGSVCKDEPVMNYQRNPPHSSPQQSGGPPKIPQTNPTAAQGSSRTNPPEQEHATTIIPPSLRTPQI